MNHLNCKIIAFEVKKITFLIPYKKKSANFESSWLKIFAIHKVKVFDIVLRNWIENLKNKNKNP